ncbi:trafficking protein particle complex subunit 10-like [Styela clava]
MDYKPTITYSFSESGDESLFLTLSTHLCKILQNHPVKWKRSYGRNPHQLSLDVKFLPLTTALLKRNDLVTRPYFHVFWTDCNDVDFYRSSVKSEIASWLSELFGNDIFDWLIVIVAGDASSKSNKPKLALPRTTLADKIKTDFCSKNPDRLYVLQDPMKDSSKATDSWSSLAAKIASFAVLCLEDAVTKYEDRVRSERERRNEKSWNFCSYFIMQEELAFMFEMLSLYEEALIQYNELDAMFTQYLLNAHAGDVAHWLSSFTRPITQWRSLSLWRRIDGETRQMLVEDTATLIDIRNYLFARHYHLLVVIGDLKRVTELMHTFLHSTTLELDILEVELPNGAKECWAFMSCMELTQSLSRICKQFQESTVQGSDVNSGMIMKMTSDELRLQIANLWNLARRKLFKLAELCGLSPGNETSSEDLQTVVNLISGMGEEEERDGLVKTSSLILREALSSKENFRTQYLELSELAMGTFKHMDRYRSARNIGKDLAEFYMKSDQPEKAESFLLDCVRMYQNESWPLLITDASEKLANCYKRLCNVRRYVRLCCVLMCDQYLSEEKQLYYCNELHSNSTDFGDNSLPIMLTVFANVTSVQFVPAQTTFRYNSKQQIVLHVHSKAPKNMQFKSVQLGLRRHENHIADENLDKSAGCITLEEQDEFDAFSYGTFSSDEETEGEAESAIITRDKSSDSISNHIKAQTPKNHIHRKRLISTTSYDIISTVTQTTNLGPDGSVQLVTLENPFTLQSKYVANKLPPVIHIAYELEEKDDEISWAGITCRAARNLLRRQDSCQSLTSIHSSMTNIVMETYNHNLEVKDVLIRPGNNSIVIDIDTSKTGQYTLRQIIFSVNSLHFILPRILPVISYSVTREKPTLVLEHEPRLLCNIEQVITVVLSLGDYHIDVSDSDQRLVLNLPKQLKICRVDSLTVQLEDGTKTDQPLPNIKSEGTTCSITLLSNVPVHSKISINIICICGQSITVHDLGFKHHRRTQSAPPTIIHEKLLKDCDDTDSINGHAAKQGNKDDLSVRVSTIPHSPSIRRDNRGGESPVKKFLSFVREVADRVESKNAKSEESNNAVPSQPIIVVKDDFLEVTLDDPAEIVQNTTLAKWFNSDKDKTPSISSNTEKSYSDNNKDISENNNLHLETISLNSLSPSKRSAKSFSKRRTSKSPAHLPHQHDNMFAVLEEIECDDNEVLCNVSFDLPWNDLPRIPTCVTFNRLFDFSHKLHWTLEKCNSSSDFVVMISVNVRVLSPCSFLIKNHSLKFNNGEKVSITRLNEEDKKIIQPAEEINFGWKVEFLSSIPPECNAQFDMDIVDTNQSSSRTPVSYKFEIGHTRTIYTISTQIGEGSKLFCGNMAKLEMVVKRLRRDNEHEHTRSGQQLLMYHVVDTRGRWAVCGKSTGILSLPVAQVDGVECTASLEIMPLIEGLLHRPNVILQRYLKRRSSEFDEQLSSTESPVLKPPRLMDFRRGEVLNLDEFKQVEVLVPFELAEDNGIDNTHPNLSSNTKL